MSKYWKQVEREVANLFGGRRVPLSGSNSQHKTSADVFRVPRWLYIEVKRRKSHNAFWLPVLNMLRDGGVIRTEYEGTILHVFRLDYFMSSFGHKISVSDYTFKFRGNSVVFKTWLHTWNLARKEKRDTVLLVYRIHNQRGLYAIADVYSVERLEEWVRKNGKAILRKRELNHPKNQFLNKHSLLRESLGDSSAPVATE